MPTKKQVTDLAKWMHETFLQEKAMKYLDRPKEWPELQELLGRKDSR